MRVAAMLVFFLAAGGAPAAGRNIHPPITLLDAGANPVLQSGRPVSPMQTCGTCHDADAIASSSDHVSATLTEWDPLTYRVPPAPGASDFDLARADWIRELGFRHVGGGPAVMASNGRRLTDRTPGAKPDPETHATDPVTGALEPWSWSRSGVVEMNCFLCHLEEPDNEARVAELEAGRFRWAATATLAKTGLVERSDSGWTWQRDRFSADGEVDRDVHGLRDPPARNCGFCHGMVDCGREIVTLQTGLAAWATETTGQIRSPQQMSLAGINLQGREELHRAFDVHAERLLSCVNCHHSVNNPAYYAESSLTRPRHQPFEARKLQLGQYLRRPSHRLATTGTMRRCEGCHDFDASHDWLPYGRQHTERLTCEVCHIPRAYGPARSVTDWTIIDAESQPRVVRRGIDGPVDKASSLVTGYRPALLPRAEPDGRERLVPYNLTAAWFWRSEGAGRPVRLRELQAALLADGTHHPELVAGLDSDRDGLLESDELVLDTPAKVGLVKSLLERSGVSRPVIAAELRPRPIHHGVAPLGWSTRDCRSCHADASRLSEPFELATFIPGGVIPRLVDASGSSLSRKITIEETDGRLVYRPTTRAASLYVLGHDRSRLIDLVGLMALAGVIFGVGLHAGMRFRASREGRPR